MAEYLSSWNSEPKFYDDSIKKKSNGSHDYRLPQDGKRNVLITAALPYVNNVPHLGNIIGCVLSADVFSRYCKMRGYNSIYISGTDEYGTATEMKALKEGKTPQEICEQFYHLHKQIYEWFNIEFDCFGRTSTANQTEIAQDIFNKLHANGFTSVASLDQLHCGKCNKFLADRYVSGTCPICKYDDARGDQCDKCGKLIDAVDLIDPKCHICSETPVVKSSNHVFLDLKQLSPKVEEFINRVTSQEDSHWSTNAVAISKSWIKSGLEQRCITRDLKWGTPVPLEGFEDKVFYVWYDAPIGYLSITKTLLGDNWVKWWKNPENVDLYQFIGKDNVAFHAVMFPSSQLGTNDNYTMVKHLCATEYLNYENQKFSKSRGTGVFGDAVADLGIPADIWRFYLIYMRPENQDTAFSWDDFMAKVNSELLNNLGNFIHRSMTFLFNSFDGEVQEIQLTEVENELLKALDEDIKEFTALLESVKLRDALSKILEVSRRGNQYVQANKPWVLVKQEETKKRAGTIISLGTNIALLLGTMLYPFMPETSRQIREFCNIKNIIQLPNHPVQFLKAGHKICQPVALFNKLEAEKVAGWKHQFGFAAEQPATTEKVSSENKKIGKDKKSTAQGTTLTMTTPSEANKPMEKIGKKEKKTAAKSEKKSKVQVTKSVEDPALKAQLKEIRKKFNVKQVKTSQSEAAIEANATSDELEKELIEMTKLFYQTILPSYEKMRLMELELENAELVAVIEKLKKQF